MHICYITLANGARFNALGASRDKAIQNCITTWRLNKKDIASCDVKFYASHNMGTSKYGHMAHEYEPMIERGI